MDLFLFFHFWTFSILFIYRILFTVYFPDYPFCIFFIFTFIYYYNELLFLLLLCLFQDRVIYEDGDGACKVVTLRMLEDEVNWRIKV